MFSADGVRGVFGCALSCRDADIHADGVLGAFGVYHYYVYHSITRKKNININITSASGLLVPAL